MEDYLKFATTLARDAGKIMNRYFKIGVDKTIKKDNTPVTLADTSINRMVIEAVTANYPTHGIMGEEESYRIDCDRFLWVTDPVDGTIPFSLGMPTNVFSLALVDKAKDGQPVVAVVYDPYLRRLYSATLGGGAFMNNVPLKVNSVSTLSDSIVGLSGDRKDIYDARAFKSAMGEKIYRPIMVNSGIYEAMLVASGQISGAVCCGPTSHDAVTSKLIVEEAGGTVTDAYGNQQRYDQAIRGAIISNGKIHSQLAEAMKPYLKC